MTDVNDRNSITTNVEQKSGNDLLNEALRKAFQSPRGSLPEQATSSDNAREVAHDNVNHPAHYTAGGIECIDCIESMIAPIKNPTYAFLTGQSLKYLARYTMKNGVEDLRKARWYLDRLIGKVAKDGTVAKH